MKRTHSYLIFTAAFCLSCACLAAAEEAGTYQLEPDTVYHLDFQKDGTEDSFYFQTYTEGKEQGESKGVLKLYLNDAIAADYTQDAWSYSWEVSQCPLSDGTYLVASCLSDNDWNTNLLLLKEEAENFTVFEDLVPLTRQVENESGKWLSSWARVASMSDTSENTFTVIWYDTLKATGMLDIPVTYAVDGESVSVLEGSCKLDETKEWTAWQSFAVQKEIGTENAETAYQVEPGEIVHLTEYVKADETVYLKCVNENGEEGWLPDAADYISKCSEDGTRFFCGYFEEAVYAG